MSMLSSVLVDENSPLHVRNAAGLALKNALSARVWSFPFACFLPHSIFFLSFFQESTRQTDYSNRWLNLINDSKAKIKQDALITLGSVQPKAGNFASQVVAAIAAVELPQGQWPDLIEILLGFVNNQPNPNLKVATLQTIGFICETIVRTMSPFVLKRVSNPRF
jgi:importin subunit beta-1